LPVATSTTFSSSSNCAHFRFLLSYLWLIASIVGSFLNTKKPASRRRLRTQFHIGIFPCCVASTSSVSILRLRASASTITNASDITAGHVNFRGFLGKDPLRAARAWSTIDESEGTLIITRFDDSCSPSARETTAAEIAPISDSGTLDACALCREVVVLLRLLRLSAPLGRFIKVVGTVSVEQVGVIVKSSLSPGASSASENSSTRPPRRCCVSGGTVDCCVALTRVSTPRQLSQLNRSLQTAASHPPSLGKLKRYIQLVGDLCITKIDRFWRSIRTQQYR